MKIKWKTLLICIAIPLLVGGLAGFISRGSMVAFEALKQPPLSPPGWVFPVVWTILYILMGIASYIILTSNAPQKDLDKAMSLYKWQLLFNFFWSIWFFNLQLYFFSFLWIIVLWLLIFAVIILFLHLYAP